MRNVHTITYTFHRLNNDNAKNSKLNWNVRSNQSASLSIKIFNFCLFVYSSKYSSIRSHTQIDKYWFRWNEMCSSSIDNFRSISKINAANRNGITYWSEFVYFLFAFLFRQTFPFYSKMIEFKQFIRAFFS